jgi:hypothetical protein
LAFSQLVFLAAAETGNQPIDSARLKPAFPRTGGLRRRVTLDGAFDRGLAGPTRLELATSGVTGRFLGRITPLWPGGIEFLLQVPYYSSNRQANDGKWRERWTYVGSVRRIRLKNY